MVEVALVVALVMVAVVLGAVLAVVLWLYRSVSKIRRELTALHAEVAMSKIARMRNGNGSGSGHEPPPTGKKGRFRVIQGGGIIAAVTGAGLWLKEAAIAHRVVAATATAVTATTLGGLVYLGALEDGAEMPHDAAPPITFTPSPTPPPWITPPASPPSVVPEPSEPEPGGSAELSASASPSPTGRQGVPRPEVVTSRGGRPDGAGPPGGVGGGRQPSPPERGGRPVGEDDQAPETDPGEPGPPASPGPPQRGLCLGANLQPLAEVDVCLLNGR